MVNFYDYPLNEAHEDLRKTGDRLGYEVIDLLPVFKEKLGDGARYRLPNDNHFNAEIHNLIANILKQKLASSFEK